MQNEISGYVYKGDDVHSDHHYGGLPGCPAGPAATRPIGLTDACMNNNDNNNNTHQRYFESYPSHNQRQSTLTPPPFNMYFCVFQFFI